MTDNQKEKIRERVVSVRKALKLSQLDFGKRFSYSQAAVSEIEKGNKEITQRYLSSLAHAHNVNVTWLETGYGAMFVEEKTNEISDNKPEYGIVSALQETISAQKRLIEKLEEDNNRLKVENEQLKSKDSRRAG